MTLKEFFETYDLYDRGLDSAIQDDQEIVFTFSLFHCDDPMRDDEAFDYLLKARFPASAVKIVEGDLFMASEFIDGEVLEYELDDKGLKLGISWRNYRTHETPWCAVVLTDGPSQFEEIKLAIS